VGVRPSPWRPRETGRAGAITGEASSLADLVCAPARERRQALSQGCFAVDYSAASRAASASSSDCFSPLARRLRMNHEVIFEDLTPRTTFSRSWYICGSLMRAPAVPCPASSFAAADRR